jgi:hypothetical protein
MGPVRKMDYVPMRYPCGAVKMEDVVQGIQKSFDVVGTLWMYTEGIGGSAINDRSNDGFAFPANFASERSFLETLIAIFWEATAKRNIHSISPTCIITMHDVDK